MKGFAGAATVASQVLLRKAVPALDGANLIMEKYYE
jgi:hypothetical protein